MKVNQNILLLVFLLVNGFKCYNIFKTTDENSECTARYDHKGNPDKCEDPSKFPPICRKSLTVAYTEQPPYVTRKKDGSVGGMLPAMLNIALDTCCFGCNRIQFVGPFDSSSKFAQNTSLVVPIQTSKTTTKYSGHDYVHMFEVKAMSFIGPEPKHDSKKMMKIILQAVVSTWPLFTTALFMAITAGVTIWVLDHPVNPDQFNSSFPAGPFEGFWWAVVSMTTVGYGDRSPRSICARLFAMLWILIGITIFSMYSATLTTSLTSAVIASHDIVLYTRTFAILNTTSLGAMATMKENTHHVGYSSIEDMKKGLQNNEVDGFVLEDNVANYYFSKMPIEEREKFQLYKRIPMTTSSYGVLSFDKNLTRLLKSFFNSNDDQRDIMAANELRQHATDRFVIQSQKANNSIFDSAEILMAIILPLVAVTICLSVVGVVLKRRKDKNNEDDLEEKVAL